MHKAFIALLFCLVTQSALAETMNCNARQSSYDCLVCNCYHESRGEPQEGKIAVAKTVLSRSQSRSYPNSVCRVVYQPWQFSWTNDRHSNRISTRNSIDRRSLQDCREAADKAIDEGPNGLIYFYNPRHASPAWARRVTSCGKVGHHIFLVPRGETCPRNLGSSPARSSRPQETPRSSNGGTR